MGGQLLIQFHGAWRCGLAWVILLGLLIPTARAEQIKLDAALNSPLLLAGKKQTAYLKVGLTGFKLKDVTQRPPANIAIVLDKSGSMAGDKIAAAREAAIAALSHLGGDDIISVITYDTTVNVLVPATRFTDREAIYRLIRGIQADGSTALFAGVSKGADELHKFMSKERVNRIVLLSDGQANVGPSSPGELADLGSSYGREGIAVTTIGLGSDYNEDLMSHLAVMSNGRHYFARESAELAGVFDKEFGDVMKIVAQEVVLEIECAAGVRPVRVLGRDGEISAQKTRVNFNQLYSEHERYVILEVEVQPEKTGQNKELAAVHVAYDNMQTKAHDKMDSTVGARFTDSASEVESSENKRVMVSVIEQIGAERNTLATELRDKGQVEEARKLLFSNSGYLNDNAIRYKSSTLGHLGVQNSLDMQNLGETQWQAQRKVMRENQSWSNYQ